MSASSRKSFGYATLALVVLGVRRRRRRDERVAARRARRSHREQALHARRGHAGRARRHRGADQSLSLLLGRGDGRRCRRCAPTPTRVREMLEEFAATAPDGKLVLNVVDPLPFSEEEDRAEQFGLQAANVGPAGEAVYFGLAGSNSVGTTDRDSVLPAGPAQGGVPRVRPRAARLQPREHRQGRRRLADERADRRRLRSADAAAVAAVGRRRASEAAARGADVARERARDRRRRRRALDRASARCSTTARCTRSTSSSCAAAAR